MRLANLTNAVSNLFMLSSFNRIPREIIGGGNHDMLQMTMYSLTFSRNNLDLYESIGIIHEFIR